MKATDREAQLRLEESDITLSDILTKLTKNPAFISYCLPIKDRTWRIDHDTNRRKVTEEKLKKAVDTTVMIDTIEYLNDYTQTYVSPLQEQYTTYDKKVKSSYQATNIYDNKGMAIGTDLDNYHQDGLKSNITQISKENGRLYSSNLYKEFGSSERRIQDQAGYRSQYHDNSADIHLRAREYNTTTGRFLQQDTVLGDLETPVTQNKYVYANNNPFMYRDDAGRKGFFSNLVDGAKKLYNKYVPAPIRNAVDKYIVQPIVKVATGRVNIGFPQPNPLLNNPFVNNNSLYGQFPQSVILNGKTYNLSDPIIRSIYNQAVESRKKAEARKQKMCEEANDKIEEDVSSKYNLVKITDSPDEVYRKYIELSQKGIHPHTGKKISKEEAKKFQYAAWAGTITDFAGVVYGGYYASKGTVNIGSKSTGSKNTTSKGAKEAGKSVPKSSTGSSKPLNFGNENLLNQHYEKHVVKKQEFGNISKDVYLKQANSFINTPSDSTLSKIRANGDRVLYNQSTNEFSVVSSDGNIRTYFKPDPSEHGYSTNLEYYNAQ